MVFDDRISESISLSRILDCFIEDNESPKTILSFLEEHFNFLDDILGYSYYSDRLFFLDFIAKCSYDECIFVLKMIKSVDHDRYQDRNTYLVWQILQSNLSDRIKNLFRPYLSSVKPKSHPYSGYCGSIVSAFDSVFIDTENTISTIAEKINQIGDKKFFDISYAVRKSMFYNRILQKDLFMLLDISKQYIILNGIFNSRNTHFFRNFCIQILDSPVDTGIKKAIYDILQENRLHNRNIKFHISDDIKEILENSCNTSQLMLKMNLYGFENCVGEVLFFLLYNNELDCLNDIMEYDIKIMKDYLDICDLLEFLIRK